MVLRVMELHFPFSFHPHAFSNPNVTTALRKTFHFIKHKPSLIFPINAWHGKREGKRVKNTETDISPFASFQQPGFSFATADFSTPHRFSLWLPQVGSISRCSGTNHVSYFQFVSCCRRFSSFAAGSIQGSLHRNLIGKISSLFRALPVRHARN